MTVKEFMILSQVTKDDIQAKISRLERPLSVGGKEVPETLNKLTIGDLFELQNIQTDEDLITVPCKVILGIDEDRVMKLDATEVFGFVMWVSKEVEKINKLFERTRIPPTKEEKQAGVEELNFGGFGILDWYCSRMGLCDHDLAAHTPWMRVYKCLDMDAKRSMYERRLREVYANKGKK